MSLLCTSNGERVQLAQGRCLGAIVSYIYDRYKAQNEFKETKFYNIGLRFNKDNEDISVLLKKLKFSEQDIQVAKDTLTKLHNERVYVSAIEKKEITKYPSKLFSLDKLQNKMSKSYKFSNQETLSHTQKLYEQGYLTYPRTNTEYLASNEVNKAQKTLEAIRNGLSLDISDVEIRVSKKIFDDSKVESHSAIIPTSKVPDLNALGKQEKLIYMTVVNRFLANFCTVACKVEETKVIITVASCTAEMKGIIIKQEGFLKYEPSLSEKTIPRFTTGERIKANLYLHEGKTQAPKNVSVEELNNFLKNPFKKTDITINVEDDAEEYKSLLEGLEIGTVATRAGILENAKKYNYISERYN